MNQKAAISRAWEDFSQTGAIGAYLTYCAMRDFQTKEQGGR